MEIIDRSLTYFGGSKISLYFFSENRRCLYGIADGKKGSIIFRSFEYYSEIVKTVLDILKYMFLRGIYLDMSMSNRKKSKFIGEK